MLSVSDPPPCLGSAHGSWKGCIWYISYAYKKAARPCNIAGAEVLENTYRKATFVWSRRYTVMAAHGIPLRILPQTDRYRKIASVHVSPFRCQLNFPDSFKCRIAPTSSTQTILNARYLSLVSPFARMTEVFLVIAKIILFFEVTKIIYAFFNILIIKPFKW